MSDADVSPPTEWYEATPCPVDGCEVEKFVPLAMDRHIVNEHGVGVERRSVAEQIDSGGRR